MTSESAFAAPVDEGIMFWRQRARGEVALAVRDVEQGLVVRVRVDRRHEAALDAEACRGGPRAMGARQFVVHEPHEMTRVLRRVVELGVDAEHDRDVVVLRRGAR